MRRIVRSVVMGPGYPLRGFRDDDAEWFASLLHQIIKKRLAPWPGPFRIRGCRASVTGGSRPVDHAPARRHDALADQRAVRRVGVAVTVVAAEARPHADPQGTDLDPGAARI